MEAAELPPWWAAYVTAMVRFVDNTMSLGLRRADGAAPNLPVVCLALKLTPSSVCGPIGVLGARQARIQLRLLCDRLPCTPCA